MFPELVLEKLVPLHDWKELLYYYINIHRQKEKNFTFIPTSPFRDRSLFGGFIDKNIHSHR